MTLNFKQWERLDEANLFDKIKNFLSGAFGGSVSKLDNLGEEYRSAEMEYVEEWEKTQEEIDKLELERSQTKADPAELKKIDRLIVRNNQLLTSQAKAHEKRTDEIFSKVKKTITENKRLRIYWEKIKTKIDAEVSQDMYEKAKKMSDSSLSGTLYNKYKDAVLKAKKKDEEFREKYGNLMTREIQAGPRKYAKDSDDFDDDVDPKKSSAEVSFSRLSKLSISDFTSEVKDLGSKEAKSLVSYLIKQRNERYVAMDLERDALNKYVEASTNKDKARDAAADKIKDIRARYMSEIRDLRSKITIARKYA
jgi:hypothetical protein